MTDDNIDTTMDDDVGDDLGDMGDTASQTPEWLGGAEYQELMADEGAKNILSSYQNPQEAAKAIVEKERLLASGLRVPKTLKPEHIELLKPHIARINGVPEKPEEYEMVRPEELDESIDLSELTKMEMRSFAKEAGIGKQAFQGIYERSLHAMARDHAQVESARQETQETARKETAALMQKYWGPQEYQRLNGNPETKQVGLIEQFAKSRATDAKEYDDLAAALESSGVRNNPLLFKILGDASRFYEILEGHGTMTQSEFAATAGTKRLSEESKNAQRFPNTPQSMGGGKPG